MNWQRCTWFLGGLLLTGSFVLSCRGQAATETNPAGNPVGTKAAATSQNQPAASANPEQQDNPEAVKEVTLSSGFLELTGTANPSRTSRVSAKGSGILRTVYAREGDRVKNGQLLCSLDATDISLRVEAAKIAADLAQEGVDNAKRDFNRVQKLFKAGALTDTNMEKIQTALRMAELQQKQADVGFRMAQQALYDTQLRAPFAGVVTKVVAEEGQYITSMPPTTIYVLADTESLEVRVPVPERDLARVKPGTPVTVMLPAVLAKRDGKVDRIADVVDPMTRSAEAIIRLDNRDHALPAGLFARVLFPTIKADAATADSSVRPSDNP